ncbi:MAG: hypothetical protein EXR70_12920 [Deltaproteobacteria bacterium]|nr:hypothetical protein [Deltaproteobacteria bacterium]
MRLAKIISSVLFCAWYLTPLLSAAEKTLKSQPVRIGIVSKSTLDLPFWVARGAAFFAMKDWTRKSS